MSLVPSLVVAIAVGRNGINGLLVASQVILSIVLPFVAFPLIYLTSNEVVMRVRKPPPDIIVSEETPSEEKIDGVVVEENEVDVAQIAKHQEQGVAPQETIDYSNGRVLTTLSYGVWCIVFVANAYAIVMLCIGVQ